MKQIKYFFQFLLIIIFFLFFKIFGFRISSSVSGKIFELGRGENHSINEVAEMFGENYPTKYIPARKGEYPFTLADYTKANQELDWTPTLDIKDYISEVIK